MRLAVAKITKPHGIRGEVRASVLLDSPELFCRIKTVYLEDVKRKISSRKGGDAVICAIEGVMNRDDAELLRGKTLYVDRADAEGLKENEYFIDDLIGSAVIVGEKRLGTIVEIYKGGRTADVFEISGEKNIMLPFLKRLQMTVDLPNKTVTFDERAFYEVAVYEN